MLPQAEQIELEYPDLAPLTNPTFTAPEHDHAGRYAEWIAANPWVVDVAERITAQIVESGQPVVSMKEVWERMRRAYRARFAATAHRDFHANNNFTAYVARDVLTRRPDWAERRVIRTRRTRA